MAMCIICNKNKAVIQDRNNPFSGRKKICNICHSERLKDDMKIILANYKKNNNQV